jgi:hypothetical protein
MNREMEKRTAKEFRTRKGDFKNKRKREPSYEVIECDICGRMVRDRDIERYVEQHGGVIYDVRRCRAKWW